MSVLLSIEQPLQIFNTEAHYNGTVNGGEGLAVEPADILAEPRFVYRSDLFEQDGGFGLETACYYRYMGGQSRFCLSACDRRHDGGGAVLVASIILQNQNRTNALCFVSIVLGSVRICPRRPEQGNTSSGHAFDLIGIPPLPGSLRGALIGCDGSRHFVHTASTLGL